MGRRLPVLLILTATVLLGLPLAGKAFGNEGGLTEPRVLPPFDASAPDCTPPPGLKRALGFAQDNRRKFIEGVGYGLAMAARRNGLDYQDVVADNDPDVQTSQITAFNDEKLGAIVTSPVDPVSLAPSLQRFMAAGGYVGAVVPPPATTILNAPQYLTGKVLANDAAAYIRNSLDGRANVVLLTQDSLQFLAPRFSAIRDTLRTLPGVNIVADLSPSPVNEAGGYATMKIVLEAHPEIDVVLGSDTVVIGALRALREAGKDRPQQYLGGIDGEPDAVREIKRSDGPYRASIALASPIFGYALGEKAADWLAGKSVPQAIDILPIALTRSNIAQYEADLADPASVYDNRSRRDVYLRMYGNICYDSRDQYLNFPWSSEAN